MTHTLRWTATLILPGEDGEITDESGWWAPDWSRFEVSPDPEYGHTDTYEPEEDLTPVQWAAQLIERTLGAVDASDSSAPRWWSACDADQNYTTGVDVIGSAHPEGFTPHELVALSVLLGTTRTQAA